MEVDILNYWPTVMFLWTPCSFQMTSILRLEGKGKSKLFHSLEITKWDVLCLTLTRLGEGRRVWCPPPKFVLTSIFAIFFLGGNALFYYSCNSQKNFLLNYSKFFWLFFSHLPYSKSPWLLKLVSYFFNELTLKNWAYFCEHVNWKFELQNFYERHFFIWRVGVAQDFPPPKFGETMYFASCF